MSPERRAALKESKKDYDRAYFKNLSPQKKAENNEAHRIWQRAIRPSAADRIREAWEAESRRINNEPLPGAYEAEGDE